MQTERKRKNNLRKQRLCIRGNFSDGSKRGREGKREGGERGKKRIKRFLKEDHKMVFFPFSMQGNP